MSQVESEQINYPFNFGVLRRDINQKHTASYHVETLKNDKNCSDKKLNVDCCLVL